MEVFILLCGDPVKPLILAAVAFPDYQGRIRPVHIETVGRVAYAAEYHISVHSPLLIVENFSVQFPLLIGSTMARPADDVVVILLFHIEAHAINGACDCLCDGVVCPLLILFSVTAIRDDVSTV